MSKSSFLPGWGAYIADAIEASCSAYPFFKIKKVKTESLGELHLIDGGFVASNPTIIAYIDAMESLKTRNDTKILSIGTGDFVDKKPIKEWFVNLIHLGSGSLIDRMYSFNSNSLEIYSNLISGDRVSIFRINESSTDIKTNLFEKKKRILQVIYNFGKDSYKKNEEKIISFLEK